MSDPVPGGLAVDLVTHQPLFVRTAVADTVAEYAEAEDFDLAGYKMHPFLPVREDDTVYECVFIGDLGVKSLHEWGDVKTYDLPRGRLATVPVWDAWQEADDE